MRGREVERESARERNRKKQRPGERERERIVAETQTESHRIRQQETQANTERRTNAEVTREQTVQQSTSNKLCRSDRLHVREDKRGREETKCRIQVHRQAHSDLPIRTLSAYHIQKPSSQHITYVVGKRKRDRDVMRKLCEQLSTHCFGRLLLSECYTHKHTQTASREYAKGDKSD
jgi:hypothetical protein